MAFSVLFIIVSSLKSVSFCDFIIFKLSLREFLSFLSAKTREEGRQEGRKDACQEGIVN